MRASAGVELLGAIAVGAADALAGHARRVHAGQQRRRAAEVAARHGEQRLAGREIEELVRGEATVRRVERVAGAEEQRSAQRTA